MESLVRKGIYKSIECLYQYKTLPPFEDILVSKDKFLARPLIEGRLKYYCAVIKQIAAGAKFYHFYA